MSVTLTPAEGVRNHPPVERPRPAMKVTAAGPGRYRWRVYDEAAHFNVRSHWAYAAGHVSFPVDATRYEIDDAFETAQAEAEGALEAVRKMLKLSDVPPLSGAEWRVLRGAAEGQGVYQPYAEDLDAADALIGRYLVRQRPGFPACLEVTPQGRRGYEAKLGELEDARQRREDARLDAMLRDRTR